MVGDLYLVVAPAQFQIVFHLRPFGCRIDHGVKRYPSQDECAGGSDIGIFFLLRCDDLI
jgi:hypothetical protein